MENDNNQQQGLQIDLKPEIAKGVYANLALITHSSSDFVLDFATMLPGMLPWGSGEVRTWSPPTRPPPVPRGWVGCHRCSSQWPPPRSSGTRMSPSPLGCGVMVVMPSCMSTPGAPTPWSSSMHDGSHADLRLHATCGWTGCFDRRTRASMSWPWRRPAPIPP